MLWINEPREYSREEERPNDERDRAEALDRALQFALFPFAHTMSHHSLGCRERNVPHRNYRDGCHVNSAASGQTSDDHPERAKKLTDAKCPLLTEPSDDSTG